MIRTFLKRMSGTPNWQQHSCVFRAETRQEFRKVFLKFQKSLAAGERPGRVRQTH